jgi:hypothetical protein
VSSLRDAYRSLVGAPWSTAAMVLTLGIGIGASTAVYAVFNHALLRPVPGVASTDRLAGRAADRPLQPVVRQPLPCLMPD